MPTRPLATSRGKNENLKVVRGWLEECQSHHSFCRRSEDTQTQLPTRLIEIAEDGTAQLVETRGQVGQYVALSYCWGQHPEDNRSTTVYNVQTRLLAGGLPRDELPAAIRDAVSITEELGIKYICMFLKCHLPPFSPFRPFSGVSVVQLGQFDIFTLETGFVKLLLEEFTADFLHYRGRRILHYPR